MIARITQFRIRRGKTKEFAAIAESMMSTLDNLDGFRVLLLLRGDDPGGRDAISISVWDSPEHLKASENDKFYYEGLTRIMSCCESFSPMHQHKVLKCKIAKPKRKSA
jgi:heme-degrading monooxygenase HmoA